MFRYVDILLGSRCLELIQGIRDAELGVLVLLGIGRYERSLEPANAKNSERISEGPKYPNMTYFRFLHYES